MMDHDAKADLLRYLQEARESLVWKVDGLGEYDIRRPLTPTGTNLLGLIKHLSGVELGYFGDTFGRPFFDKEKEPPAWWYTEDAELNADMWAIPQESREQIVDLYRRAWEHANATIDALTLDAVGRIPWWPEERSEVTLHHVIVRVLAETHRHAGHADIVRELVDGSVGEKKGNGNIPEAGRAEWERYRDRLERAAREADGV
ncbi:DinB family protein [Streptomyces sp. NPDC005244]|uniref:DinB family protein n=1 Tax=Streptomyces sp. NPDC005244 TaxID=3364708 RepID=UPI00368F4755